MRRPAPHRQGRAKPSPGSWCRSTTRPGCTGTCAWSTTASPSSWAVPNGIPEDPKNNRMAIHTEDHPLEYLELEGDIPKGSYGAGSMRIWDRGVYETHKFDDSKVEVTFHGERLRGRYGLFPLHRQGRAAGKDWMIHRMDPAEDPDREPMPEQVVPMLARLADLPSDTQRWAFEVKWDGVRALAYSEPGRLRLEARSGNDITKRYPELRRLNRALSSHSAILDGEIVAFDDRGPSELRRAAAADAHRVRGASAKRLRQGVAGRLRRSSTCSGSTGTRSWPCPYAERRELPGAPRAAGPDWQVPEHSPATAATCWRRPAARASRASSPSGSTALRARAARGRLAARSRTPARTSSSSAAGCPGRGGGSERIGALLVGVRRGRATCATRAGSAPASPTDELDRLVELLAPLERDEVAVDAPARSPRAARCSSSRGSSPRSSTPSGPRSGMLRHPPTRGCARTSPRRPSVVRRGGPPGGTRGRRRRPRAQASPTSTRSSIPRPASPRAISSTTTRAIAPVLLPHLATGR